jgi:hypothetical protein
MKQPTRWPLVAPRHAAFIRQLTIPGDYTGASLRMMVRETPEAPGDPLIDLGDAAVGSEGLNLSVATVSGLPWTTITVRIDTATMAAMPAEDEVGDDWTGVWDITVTPVIGDKFFAFRGPFIVRAGVTR